MDSFNEEAYALDLHLKNRQRLHDRVEQCRREGTCFCKYKTLGRLFAYKRRDFVSYHHDEKQNQENQLRRSKVVPQQDQRPFRLMDLPIELRLRIYEIAFETGRYQELAPRRASDVVEPALLRTNRQIRKEAIRVFHGTSCFRFQLPELYAKKKAIDFLEGHDFVWLTHIQKSRKITFLRKICFRLSDAVDIHDLHIDLDHCSVWRCASQLFMPDSEYMDSAAVA